MSARSEKKPIDRSPLVRVRQMMMVIAGITTLLTGPLLLVWKQTYIRGSSVRLEATADTLSMLDKEISLLQLKSERLSSTERIETFARATLELEYPSSDRMVMVSLDNKNKRRNNKAGSKAGELFATVQDRFAKGGPR
jgi:cell division protein FtsL